MKDYKVVEIKALMSLMKKSNVTELEMTGLKIKMNDNKPQDQAVQSVNYINEKKESNYNDILFHSAE